MTDITFPAEPAWRRLSPLTLLLAVVRLGPRSLQMIPAFAAIGFASSWIYVVPALALFLFFSLGFAWLGWVRFRWLIGDDAIVIESGIFARQHRTIPFDRIQDVSIEQGLVARALDLAKVGFETGASSDSEKGDGALDSISLTEAEVLRTSIRAWRSGVGEPVATTVDSPAPEPLADDEAIFRLSPKNLLLAGVFNFSLAALAVFGAAAQWFDDLLPFNLFDPRVWVGFARDAGLDGWIAAHQWIAGLGAIAILLLVGFATGVVRTILTNWNFLLSLGPRAFRRVRGLTTRTDVAIPLSRIQAAVVATGIIRRRWGWHELRVQSLASDGKDEKDHQLIPFGQIADIDAALGPTGMARPDDAEYWHRVSLAAQAYPGLIAALATLPASAVLAFLNQPWWPIPPLVGAVLLISAVVTARQHRWSATASTLYIRRGWWSRRLTIVPFANVQSADLTEGPVLRRLGCLELVLGVPGDSGFASHSIDAVPGVQAAELRQRILAARSPRS